MFVSCVSVVLGCYGPGKIPLRLSGLFLQEGLGRKMAIAPIKPQVLVTSFDDKSVVDYIRQLEEIVEQFGPDQTILLHISSFGGSVYGLGMLYEFIQTIQNPIATYTTSKAMSAGAILLSAGGTKGMRFASPSASIMIHEVQGGVWPDDIKNLENNIESLKQDNEKWMTILAKSMGLKNGKDIRQLIKDKSIGHDLMLTAKQAKDLNIIDKVCYVKLGVVFGYNLHTSEDLTIVPPPETQQKKKPKRKKG